MFLKKRVTPDPLPEPPNPFNPEQTAMFGQILDDALVTTMVAVDANNEKQMDWCLTITGSIITAVIIAVFLHPAFLPGFTRIFLCVLLLSAGFGLWAKMLMTGDKPEVVSLRSPQIEEMLKKIRPQTSNISSLPLEEQKRVAEEILKQFDYIQFNWLRMLGKVYTVQQRNSDVQSWLVSPGTRERDSVKFRKTVEFKAFLINVQLSLAVLAVLAIVLGIICRIRV
jgi:hypothetical protein